MVFAHGLARLEWGWQGEVLRCLAQEELRRGRPACARCGLAPAGKHGQAPVVMWSLRMAGWSGAAKWRCLVSPNARRYGVDNLLVRAVDSRRMLCLPMIDEGDVDN